MAVVINTNVDALKIQNQLKTSTTDLSAAMQRMSSGLKIISAKDDAAGNVISARMEVQLNGNKICQNNVQNANSLLSTAEGNIDVVLENISRIRDLTLQAKNGTYSDEEIQAMQDEVEERINEIDRVSKSAKYSQLLLFGDIEVDDDGKPKSPETLTGLAKNGATFQVGANASDNDTIKADAKLFQKVTFSALTGFNKTTVDEKEVSTFNLKDIKNDKVSGQTLATALTKLDDAIDNLTDRKSIIGSAQNRLNSALETLTTQYSNLSSANSLIKDADIAQEASNFTQNQILQQVSTSLLAQANQAPAIALSLI